MIWGVIHISLNTDVIFWVQEKAAAPSQLFGQHNILIYESHNYGRFGPYKHTQTTFIPLNAVAVIIC